MARGEATRVTVMVALLGVVMVLCSKGVDAVVYKVGDAAGWSFNSQGWENGKKFKAGDVLVFNYNPNLHNVVRVDKASFDKCVVPPNAPILKSGNDRVTLQKGENYFICGIMGHCDDGMQIAPFAS